MKKINIEGYENYMINEEGIVFSLFKNRWLKPSPNGFGYYHQSMYNSKLNAVKKMYIHRLVAFTYLDTPADFIHKKYEVDHIDGNKGNNHYSNLRWVTHQYNILRSYSEQNRISCLKGKHFPSPALETRLKMASAKHKKVECTVNNKTKIYNSIDECIKSIGWYRKKFNRTIDNGGKYKNISVRIIEDARY